MTGPWGICFLASAKTQVSTVYDFNTAKPLHTFVTCETHEFLSEMLKRKEKIGGQYS